MEVPVAFGAVSFASTAFGLITSNLSNLNSLRHSFVKFRRRVQSLRRNVELCEAQLLDWDKTWNYNNYSDNVYRFLWGDLYDKINKAREDVKRDVDALILHIERVLDNPDRRDPAWRRHFALHRKPILRRFVFALLSEASLTKEISQLRDDLNGLKDLSDQRIKSIRGPKPSAANIGSEVAMRLGNLGQFGQDLFQKLRPLATTSEWALELRPPEGGGDAEKWQTETVLRVWFTFVVGGPQGGDSRRVYLQYELKARTMPDGWVSRVVDPDNNHHPPGNPKVASGRPHVQKTKPFRALFKGQFFDNRRVRKQWESDQAHLLLSLTNWAILLWASDWTTNLCCSGIRFVKAKAEAGAINEGPCLHSLTIQPSHVLQAQQARQLQQGQPQAQQGENEECHHTGPKLKNLGLALAETICGTPFRRSPTITSQYEKWDRDVHLGHLTWVAINEYDLLELVHQKSNNSREIRDAVDFCLTVDEYR